MPMEVTIASALHGILLALLLFKLMILGVAQTVGEIRLGSSITAGGGTMFWGSPSGEFAFGFKRVVDDANINNGTRPFLLAIWFNRIPEQTTVWYAKTRANPVPIQSKVELTNDGNLVLSDPQGRELWKAQSTINGTNIINSASMGDDGNFVLKYKTSGIKAWESFKDPTDTMLPTQVLELGDSLSSRQSESNFSRGRFQLLLQQDGNLVLNTVALPTNFSYSKYYSSGTSGSANISQSGYRLVFHESGYMYVLRRNNERFEIKPRTIDPSSYVYYRATLGSDGVFSLYSRPKVSNSNQNWTIVWSIPDDICSDLLGDYGSGACGYNSYCVLTNGRPSCECPTGYSFVNQNDRLSGCKPDFTLIGCEQKEYKPDDLYEMLTLRNTDWPKADYEQMRPYVEEDCKISCLQDCLCAVAIFRNDTCWKKKLPLSNGRFNIGINSTALIKVGRNGLISQSPPALGPPSPSTKDRKSTVIILGSLLGSSVFLNFVLLTSVALVLLFMYQKKLGQPVVLDGNQQQQSALGTSLRSFTYKELEEATDGFREEIGRGAFGIVYKGSLAMMGDPTRNLVAVKKLDTVRIQDGEKEFKTEVSIIGKTHHKNLVQLLGFCQEGPHRLLVYEFMCNGSLASLLFGDLVIKPNWYQRNQIVLGIAKGLTYLHEECKSQIIHCDIKPQNILLDNYFTARISDFGLAKLLTDQTRTLTGIRGTRGYVATEWFKNTPVTVKVDVYSFGVVLLEIVSCRKSVELELGGEERSILTDWAYDCYREGRLHELVEKDEDAVNDIRKVEMLVMIAIWCIQEEPSLRPSMKKVTHMLEGVIEVPIPPCPFPQEFSII